MTWHTSDEARDVEDPTDVKFVGPATAPIVESANFSAQDILDKTVSYKMLIDAGVNAGVAAKIRRWHSLSWSFDSGDDLDRRSEQVRGLQDEERAWVAASYGEGDVEGTASPTGTTEDSADDDDDFAAEAAWVQEARSEAETDGSGDPVAAESAWRERSTSRPVSDIDGIGEAYAERLGEAGINTVRTLASTDPREVADATGIAVGRVERWRSAAEDLESGS